MKLLTALCLISFILFLFSCKKESTGPQDQTDTIADVVNAKMYMPLHVGNYWIYEYYYKDASGNYVSNGSIDSVFISTDTIIHNDTFFVFQETSPYLDQYYSLRDSLSYLVDPGGKKLFSAENFEDTLMTQEIEAFHIAYKMNDKDSLISIPIGTFSTYNYKGYVYDLSVSASPKFNYTFYAKNIGIIKRASFYASTFSLPEPTYIEQRLIRYHVE